MAILSNSHIHPMAANAGLVRSVVKPRRISNYEKALVAARSVAGFRSDMFYMIDSRDLIGIFDKLKPVYNGKPQRWMHALINCGPSDNPPMSKTGSRLLFMALTAGLVYRIPPIPKKAKTKFRLTQNGVILLDHWAEKHPRFKPFVDAYLPMKARGQIASDCVDFALGIVPKRIRIIQEKAEVELQKMSQGTATAQQNALMGTPVWSSPATHAQAQWLVNQAIPFDQGAFGITPNVYGSSASSGTAGLFASLFGIK